MKTKLTLALVLTAFASAAGAVGTKLGTVIANADGMTLYTFDKDEGGVSACYGGCAKSWPPFIAKDGAAPEGDFGLTTRDDGAQQWTWKGQPLYLWVNDRKPGDVTGDGVGGTWRAAVE